MMARERKNNCGRKLIGDRNSILKTVCKYKFLYLMVIPGVLFFLIFSYAPLTYLGVAFQRYNPVLGYFDSPWAGLDHFTGFINGILFPRLMRNTLVISILKLIIGFPAPIILALMLNDVGNRRFKKLTQTVSYLPHFISWVVVVGFLDSALSPVSGFVNQMIASFGGTPVYFMAESKYFLPIVVLTSIWKGVGWNTIIYLAAITSVDQELYEAASIDGCSRLRQAWHVTLPGIRPTIAMLLILNIAGILNTDTEQLIALIGNNRALLEIGDTIDTYVYRFGIQQGNFSNATAVGLFKGVISFILLAIANWGSRKLGEDGIF